MDFSQEGVHDFQDRFPYAMGAVAVFFLLILVRLGYLQIVKGSYLRSFSQENTVKEIKIPATRGIIYDRFRRVLTNSRPAFDIVVVPQYVRSPEKMGQGLFALAKIPPDWSEGRWRQARLSAPFFPFVFKRDASPEEVNRIRTYRVAEVSEEDPYDLRGVEVFAYPVRDYPWHELAGVVLGHVGQVSPEDLVRFHNQKKGREGYRAGDFIGASGLEKVWEPYLRGKDGYEQRIVDAVGREVVAEELNSLLVNEAAKQGSDLVLTLDLDLQKVAEEGLGSRTGAVVALNPQNGEVLVLVSKPSYDPNILATTLSHEAWNELLNDPRKRFLNRTFQSAYPPGSTYKIVTAIAALEEGVISPEEKVACHGQLPFGNRSFRCWRSGGHGAMAIHDAIVQSCDVFFYTMGIRLGVDKIAKYARMLGLGQPTGIDMEGEKKGLVPTSKWKLEVKKEPWQPAENLSIAIGQGYDLVSPLQNALVAAQVGNGGRRIFPQLLHHFETREGRQFLPVGEGEPSAGKPFPLKPETLRIVREALAGVVADSRGTAHSLAFKGIPIAGKTGTAQVVSDDLQGKIQGVNTGDHAWFVAYSPTENPEIAVSVLVEHGGHGASAAAPIAGVVIRKFFALKKEREAAESQPAKNP